MTKTNSVLISDELLDGTIEEICKVLDDDGDYKKAFDRGVYYIKIKSYNASDTKIRQFLINHFTTKPTKKENEGVHDYATRVLNWKKSSEALSEFIRVIQIKRPSAFSRLKSQPIFKSNRYLIITLFSIWTFVHFLFYENDTYTITTQAYTYLYKVNSRVYNEYIYKLPKDGNYSSDLIAHTTKQYFGVFPDWIMNFIYFGYLIIILYSINLESKNNVS